MSRDTSLPSGVQTAAESAAYSARHAVRIDFSTPLLVCEGPGTLLISAETYVEGLLSTPVVGVGPSPTASFRVVNGNNEVSEPDADSDELRDVAVLVYEVLWDPTSGAQLDPVLIFSGVIQQATYTAGYADLQCVSRTPSAASAGMVGRYVGRTCGLIFKGLRCGYAGATASCDHTLVTCTGLSNNARFGGWPSAPAIGQIFRYRTSNGTTTAHVAGTLAAAAAPAEAPTSRPIIGRRLKRGNMPPPPPRRRLKRGP